MEVFKLVAHTPTMVVIKVEANTPLVVAMNPWLQSDYEYITVTRGKNHTLTVTKKDGKTFSFDWGENGYSLISESLKMLRQKAIEFIERECCIMLEICSYAIREATVCFNHNFDRWQLSIDVSGGRAHTFFEFGRETDVKVALQKAQRYIECEGWMHMKAITGIDVWKAKNPKLKEVFNFG